MSVQNLDSTPLAFQLVPTEQDCADVGAVLVDRSRDRKFDSHRMAKLCYSDMLVTVSSYANSHAAYVYVSDGSCYQFRTSYRFMGNGVGRLHAALTTLSPNLVTGFCLAYKLGLLILLGDKMREVK